MKHNQFHISNIICCWCGIDYEGFLTSMSAQWRIHNWYQGGFPKVANLNGWWRSVSIRVSLTDYQNNQGRGGGGVSGQSKNHPEYATECTPVSSKCNFEQRTTPASHIGNGFFPETNVFKILFWANHNPHILKGFLLYDCALRSFKLSFVLAKHNPHLTHVNGFSPVSVHKYIFKLMATHTRVSLKRECTRVLMFYRRRRNIHIMSYFTGWWERKWLFRAKLKLHTSLLTSNECANALSCTIQYNQCNTIYFNFHTCQ